jgi:hypothetical protein
MNDEILNALPVELQKDLIKLIDLEMNGWSLEWYSKAKDIIYQMNLLRDDGKLPKNVYDIIYSDYLKEMGKLEKINNNFLNFYFNRK